MNIGIVGSEGKKFTPEGERQAREKIREIINAGKLHTGVDYYDLPLIISGGCHLGGIDIWAIEEAVALGCDKRIHLPRRRSWKGGYKDRNLLIAQESDIVHCIVVDVLPDGFDGMTHDLCYHCRRSDHVKSGGCWTMLRAKRGQLHIVSNYPQRTGAPHG